MHRSTLLCFIAACGAAPIHDQPGPRGLRADQHLSAATRENERAAELTHWPDVATGDRAAQPPDRLIAGGWFGTWNTVSEHRQLALVHRSAAAELEAEYEQACGETPSAIVSESPLQRYGIGGSPIEGGTLVLLSSAAGPPDRLLSEMRCHRAWMMLGRTDMDDCPLDLAGLHVSARGDEHGVELTITVSDPALVDVLRRRAAHDLEAAQRHSPAPR